MLVLAGLIGAGALWVSRMTEAFDDAVVASRALEERHGRPGEFTPQPDGSIPAARMEAFLKVRRALGPPRDALAETFSRLPMDRHQAEELERKSSLEKLAMVVTIGKEALGLGPEIGAFFRARDQALLDAAIGMGEYSYIYTVAYYAWLGHSPADGPRSGPREEGEPGDTGIRMMGSRVMSRVRGDLLQMLRNQVASLPPGAPKPWSEALRAEVEALEKDDERLPWQDGVPAAIAASLEPYRERLEAAYSPAANPFELSRNTRRGRLSYQAD